VALALVAAALVAVPAAAWYLPGTGPRDYHLHEHVDVQVNALSSVHTHVPYDYYSLPFCYPTKNFRGEPENLGEILMGDRIKPSAYEQIRVGEDADCIVPCGARTLDEATKKKLAERIKDDYTVNLIMDALPLAIVNEETGMYSVGVPLGTIENGVAYIYNHLQFTIRYYELTQEEVQKTVEAHKKKHGKLPTKPAKPSADAAEAEANGDQELEEEETSIRRIISFIAKPYSVKHDAADPSKTWVAANFSLHSLPPQKATDDQVVFTYGVTWEATKDRWANRWDPYLNVQDHEIHWFNIVNSVLIVLILTAIVAFIFLRILRRDINKYNRLDLDPEDLQDETGWKIVHKEVFRAPSKRWLLAAFAGTGTQLYGCTWTVIIFACLGFLSPANRGSLFTAMLIFFVFLGMYAGYTSARLLKLWDAPSWKNIFFTATIVPGVAFTTFFMLNLAVWAKGSSAAVPFTTIVAVVAMWFCISLPLVFLGAVFGFKRETIKLPVSVAQIPRHIPKMPWHMNPYFTVAIAGILPFGAVFIEIFFILTAVWLNRYYYVFGFLLLVFLILTVTCAEITIVMTYFQLCAEDYQWWWRSFLTSGSCGGYLFLYTAFYFVSSLRMKGLVPVMLYFSYMGLLSFIFFVMTGTIGFMATFAFVRYIYGSIKLD
jgi:transmembrane 9 superfamily protein 2/4